MTAVAAAVAAVDPVDDLDIVDYKQQRIITAVSNGTPPPPVQNGNHGRPPLPPNAYGHHSSGAADSALKSPKSK